MALPREPRGERDRISRITAATAAGDRRQRRNRPAHRRQAYGESSPVETRAAMIYADVALEPGAALPIDADYEERAVYIVSGKIEIAGDALRPGPAAGLPAGRPDRDPGRDDGPHDAPRRRPDGRAAPHLVELRLLVEGANRAGEGRMEARPLRQRSRRREEFIPASRTLIRRIPAPLRPALSLSPISFSSSSEAFPCSLKTPLLDRDQDALRSPPSLGSGPSGGGGGIAGKRRRGGLGDRRSSRRRALAWSS